jgi:cobalamin biosynthetic protein CobC
MRHGGDLTEAKKAFNHILIDSWIDLSTGINPNSYDSTGIILSNLDTLPTKDSYDKLVAAAKNYYGVLNANSLCISSGAQSLINILPYIFSIKKNVAIFSPTYSEHSISWKSANHSVREINKIDQILNEDIIVVTNPNNPDGLIYSHSDIEEIYSKIEKNNGLLIIDESFIDVTPELSFVKNLQNKNIIILKSFGKFFGLAGLRIGFAIGNKDQIYNLENILGPWPVSTVALNIATKAISDIDWIKGTRSLLLKLSEELNSDLFSSGYNINGSTAFFTLISVKNAKKMQHELANKGIWTRIFDYNSRWIRVGVPKDKETLEYLINTIRKI